MHKHIILEVYYTAQDNKQEGQIADFSMKKKFLIDYKGATLCQVLI